MIVRRAMVAAAAWCLVVGSTACSSNPSDDEESDRVTTTMDGTDEMVVWDFRTPLTAIDLGSKVDEFAELDGPVALSVTFPSGRVVQGTWQRAVAFAQGGANLGSKPAQPVSLVDFIDGEVHSVEEVRAAAERFVAEYGPPIKGTDDLTIDEYLTQLESIVADDGGEILADHHGTADGFGSTIRTFTAAEQDGLEPALLIRVVEGGVTIRTAVTFIPADGT